MVESRLSVILEGRVQGVGFRWWTLREARRLGLRGTVRNRPDGAVEVHAAGSAADLADFFAALRRGPPGAVVERTRDAPSPAELPDGFLVLS